MTDTTTTTTEAAVVRLPVPARLTAPGGSRAIMTGVRSYFYPLWNNSETFRDYLSSVSNKDSITKNRLFDRLRAVDMLKAAAKRANDDFVCGIEEGKVYQCIVHILRENDMGLKLRRAAYLALTHQQAAE
jgi:hypothetical protein